MDAPTHSDVASNIELLSAWIEAQMAHRAEPGLSVGIVHDQDLVWARGFGYADMDKQGRGNRRAPATGLRPLPSCSPAPPS